MISRRILAALALLCALTVTAHAQTGSPKTSAQLNAEINARITTNGKQQITAFDLRQIWLDLVSSIMPDTSVVSGNLARFNGTTGKLEDSGFSFSSTPVTLNVSHPPPFGIGNGVDSATCGSVSAPCATILHAYQLFQTTVKSPIGASAAIQSDCNFTETPPGGAAFLGPGASGPGVIAILGNPLSPASCVWSSGGISVDDGAVISLQGFTTRSTANSGQTWLTVAKLGLVATLNMVWGSQGATSSAHIQLNGAGSNFVWDGGVYQIGEASCAPTCMAFHIINNGGSVALQHTPITVPNVLAFSVFYAAAYSGSQGFISTAFTGAGSGAGSTGQQYSLAGGSTLALSGTTGFPGTTIGNVGTGACLDGACGRITSSQFPVPLPFGSLPACNGTTLGALQEVTDSTTVTWGAIITGGSTNSVSAHCNGLNWTVAGK